jgi:NADH-ubiquinone oxidoreductase chain 6
MPFTFNNVSALSSFLDLLTNLNSLLLNSDTSSFVNVLNTFNPTVADTTITSFLHIEAIGHGLYTYGASLLIICSVILLLAMTAPIFISRKSNF